MRIYFSVVLFLILFGAETTYAQPKLDSSLPITEFIYSLSETVFANPFRKEETEIQKRIHEANTAEIRKLRIRLKNNLRTLSLTKTDLQWKNKNREALEESLESFPSLGGFLWKEEEKTIYQWGDWSDFYEDGFSRDKLRLEGQIPSFPFDGGTIYFFVKNPPGSLPAEFGFLGWESHFYAFGDEGSLRYTNDFHLDPSERLGDFRKAFDSIRKKIPGSQIVTANDLTIFIVPGESKPIYYIFLFLRFFLIGWTILLSVYIIRTSLSPPKNHLPEDSPRLS
ncbi:hypothetical protein ND861_06850 [Leptospira sp. 2 VSF19]|uniref:Uncharacterized protein n=1 Tax=Leptospira soteropolitanensis TaxID=2950025 RepID=A0AAW5VFF1_9LEPT|nr:hypothetical protein [Leptospira soteropolitanensis]MCW7492370.1 hypothetical protein [Leptospira soteropolitanensis]MCW7499952.1 hypothetical protein [Leptospira soteropolitanensis]MCW7522203.1 hypothetical protein [Leptospira soteropolitanensis]MCW7526057.1 hypothetical protein [Leptospira soteropolitanensis]MCW7529829.1 hypothetical protein [Leptospira soteropolitanensis]